MSFDFISSKDKNNISFNHPISEQIIGKKPIIHHRTITYEPINKITNNLNEYKIETNPLINYISFNNTTFDDENENVNKNISKIEIILNMMKKESKI